MKKKSFILLIIFLSVIFISFLLYNPILIKYLAGTVRKINDEIKCEILINGEKKSSIKLFAVKSSFDEKELRNYLILYLREENNFKGFPVLIIDKQYNTIAFPNASEKDYNIILGNLFQSESGANLMVPIKDNIKGLGFNPDLKIEIKKISFKILLNNRIYNIIINAA